MLRAVVSDHNFMSLELQRAILEPKGIELLEVLPGCTTEDEVISRCAGANVLLVQRAPITRRVLRTLPDLKGVVRYGIGVDVIDLNAAKDLGIGIANVPTYCLEEVSNHAMAMILSLGRRIPQEHHRIVRGGWRGDAEWPAAFSDMTVGLVGFGAIARRVANKARAFGFSVVATDPFVDESRFNDNGAQKVDIEGLFGAADIISLHCPLLPETKHLINHGSIAKMKPDVVVVNTSRGGLICENDLIAALTNGKVSGAGLDVFETEPLPSSSMLRELSNVILTSHSASYSARSLRMLQVKAAEAALDFLQDRRPEGLII